MIIKPLSAEVAVGDATIAAARVVRLVNTGATEKVAVANTTPAELTLLANTSVVIEKEVGAAIGATSAVLATPVAFTN
jgi:hypothetical protein|tara:strand:- start:29 stop:262 length:234 start_codon:yes stop_codon:yes gene_type:complete